MPPMNEPTRRSGIRSAAMLVRLLLVPVLLQRFYYRQMMYVVLFRSVREAVRGRSVGWRGVEPEVPAPVAQA